VVLVPAVVADNVVAHPAVAAAVVADLAVEGGKTPCPPEGET